MEKLRKANPEFEISKSGNVQTPKDKYGLPKNEGKSEPADLRTRSAPEGPGKYKPKKKKAKKFKTPLDEQGKPVRKNSPVYKKARAKHISKNRKRVNKEINRKKKHTKAVKVHQDKVRRMPKKTVALTRDSAGKLVKKQAGVRKRLRSKFWKGAMKVL